MNKSKSYSPSFSILFCLFAGSLFLALATSTFAQKAGKVSADEQIQAATKAVSQNDTIAVYAKGLCCPSCGIGVRRHLGRLGFIDKTRFKSGIHLDVKTQLASVALKPGAQADHAALAKAVEKAGYEPVKVFERKAGKVIATPLFAK